MPLQWYGQLQKSGNDHLNALHTLPTRVGIPLRAKTCSAAKTQTYVTITWRVRYKQILASILKRF